MADAHGLIIGNSILSRCAICSGLTPAIRRRNADAVRRISFARRSSLTSRSSWRSASPHQCSLRGGGPRRSLPAAPNCATSSVDPELPTHPAQNTGPGRWVTPQIDRHPHRALPKLLGTPMTLILPWKVSLHQTQQATEFFADLVARGLSWVRLVTSGAHAALVAAIAANLPGAPWQRCRTH